MRRIAVVAAVAVLSVAGGLAWLGDRGAGSTASGGLQVVAAENFWGSIASQLGGNRVHVTSVITSPATDPHDYEPTAADARALAGAGLVIVNGIGYDPWAAKLIDANPVSGRVAVSVGDLRGCK